MTDFNSISNVNQYYNVNVVQMSTSSGTTQSPTITILRDMEQHISDLAADVLAGNPTAADVSALVSDNAKLDAIMQQMQPSDPGYSELSTVLGDTTATNLESVVSTAQQEVAEGGPPVSINGGADSLLADNLAAWEALE